MMIQIILFCARIFFEECAKHILIKRRDKVVAQENTATLQFEQVHEQQKKRKAIAASKVVHQGGEQAVGNTRDQCNRHESLLLMYASVALLLKRSSDQSDEGVRSFSFELSQPVLI
jgi:hypothetical protein